MRRLARHRKIALGSAWTKAYNVKVPQRSGQSKTRTFLLFFLVPLSACQFGYEEQDQGVSLGGSANQAQGDGDDSKMLSSEADESLDATNAGGTGNTVAVNDSGTMGSSTGGDMSGAGTGGSGTGTGGSDGTTGGAGTGGTSTGGSGTGGSGTGGTGSGGTTFGEPGAPCTPIAGCTCESSNGKDYQFCADTQVFGAAFLRCSLIPGKLLQIESSAENTFITNRATAWGLFVNNQTVLTGGSDLFAEGEWLWPDVTKYWSAGQTQGLYTNWASGSPTNDTKRSCMTVEANGKWTDAECSIANSYICEAPSP